MSAHSNPAPGRRSRRRAIVATILIVTAAVTAMAFDPDESRFVVQLSLTALGVIAVMAVVGALRRAAPPAPPSPLDRPRRPTVIASPPPPLDLVRATRRLAASEASAADARRHLGPMVAAIAADRLRQGAHTAIDPDFVYAQLPRPVPAPLALVLDPALDASDTRAVPGLDPDAAEQLVRALEQL